MISTDPGVWLSVIFFFFVYSFVIKDNKLFRFAEVTSIGTAAGILTATAFNNIQKLGIEPLLNQGKVLMLVPLLAGLLLFARLNKSIAYLSRIPLAIMIGSGLGVGLMPTLAAQVIGQIGGLMTVPSTPLGVIDQIIVVVGVVSTLLLFSYTIEHKGSVGAVTKIGTAILMFSLGVTYGVGITSRSTYLIDRLQKLFFELLGFG